MKHTMYMLVATLAFFNRASGKHLREPKSSPQQSVEENEMIQLWSPEVDPGIPGIHDIGGKIYDQTNAVQQIGVEVLDLELSRFRTERKYNYQEHIDYPGQDAEHDVEVGDLYLQARSLRHNNSLSIVDTTYDGRNRNFGFMFTVSFKNAVVEIFQVQIIMANLHLEFSLTVFFLNPYCKPFCLKIEPKKDFTLVGMSIHTDLLSNILVQVYAKRGTFGGYEYSRLAWNQIGSGYVLGKGAGTPTQLPPSFLDHEIPIIAGFETSFYVRSNVPNLIYGSSERQSLAIQNDDMLIHLGTGFGGNAFGPPIFSHRIWNGSLHYFVKGRDNTSSQTNLVPGGTEQGVKSLFTTMSGEYFLCGL